MEGGTEAEVIYSVICNVLLPVLRFFFTKILGRLITKIPPMKHQNNQNKISSKKQQKCSRDLLASYQIAILKSGSSVHIYLFIFNHYHVLQSWREGMFSRIIGVEKNSNR